MKRIFQTTLALSAAMGWALAQSPGTENYAWMIVSTVFVVMMVPGLAFFYAGLVRHKNILNTMMMSFIALGVVGIGWTFFGYSLAFGGDNPWIGDLRYIFMNGIGLEHKQADFPDLLFFLYQGSFAIVTTALISGAVIERMKFTSFMLFAFIWGIVIYAPVAHWVWGGGWLSQLGVLDFAGGTVVHINAAVAAIVLVLALGSRRDYGSPNIAPHSVPLTLIGTALLWLGWFGFNGGSALAINDTAVLAVVNTFLAPMTTIIVWSTLDLARSGKVTAIGVATAIIVGCVAVTPASGHVGPVSAIIIGAVAAFPSYFALLWRARTNLDDSLDVFAAHGVAGIVGALLTGVYAQQSWGSPENGLLYGNPAQVGIEVIAIVAVVAFSFVGTLIIAKVVDLIAPLRVSDEPEAQGLDVAAHGEQAYIADII